MGGKVIARGIGLGILALALVAGLGALWVYLYSIAINPGHDGAFYQLYGQRVAPVVTLAAGIPLLLLAGWLSGRGSPGPLPPLLPAVTYILLDILLMAIGGLWAPAWSLILSWLTKLAAAWAGGALARRRRGA